MSVDFTKGHDNETGQMSVEERKVLYNIAINKRPKTVVDVGTWRGNGSTYILASAVKRNGNGHVYTIEADASLCYIAGRNIENNRLIDYVTIVNLDSVKAIEIIIPMVNVIDFLMLDGNKSFDDFNASYKALSKKAIVACHDWKEAKCDGLRETLSDSKEWKQIAYSESNANHFAVFQRF